MNKVTTKTCLTHERTMPESISKHDAKNCAPWLGKHEGHTCTCIARAQCDLTYTPILSFSDSEQYLDLISAADAIIAMNKNARAVQDKLERMQHACDVGAIRQRATAAVQHGDDATDEKKHQRRLYVLAALVKSLADVPEQVDHGGATLHKDVMVLSLWLTWACTRIL